MKNYILILLFFLIGSSLNSQSEDFTYFNQTFIPDLSTSSITSKCGIEVEDGFIIVGSYSYLFNQTTHRAIYFLKRNKNGGLQWFKHLDQDPYVNGINIGSQLIRTNDNNFVLTYAKNRPNENVLESYIIKFNEFGDIIWKNKFESVLSTIFRQVIQTNNGGFAIVGSIGYPPKLLFVKVDSFGVFEYEKVFSIYEYETSGYNILQTTNDEYLITGFTSFEDDNDSTDGLLVKINHYGL